MSIPVPTARRNTRVLPAAPLRALLLMLVLTGGLYVIEAVDQFTPAELDGNGILPRELSGLDGVLWAPLLHAGWGHLLANTVPFIVLGFLAMAGGIGQFIAVTATIWVIGGFGVWLTGTPGVHLGASLLIFGWMVFLLARGFFARSFRQVMLAFVLFFFWGGMLLGVLPGQPGISWQAHLFGALGGLLAAWIVARADRPAGNG